MKQQAELNEIVKHRLQMRGFAYEASRPELVMACTEAAEEVMKNEDKNIQQTNGKNMDDKTATTKPAVRPTASLF